MKKRNRHYAPYRINEKLQENVMVETGEVNK